MQNYKDSPRMQKDFPFSPNENQKFTPSLLFILFIFIVLYQYNMRLLDIVLARVFTNVYFGIHFTYGEPDIIFN